MEERTSYEQPKDTISTSPWAKKGYPGVGQSFGALLIILGIAFGIQVVMKAIEYFLPKDISTSETGYLAIAFLSYGLSFLAASMVLISIKKNKEGTRYNWFPQGHIGAADILVVAVLTALMGIATEPVYKLIPSIEFIDELIRKELARLIRPHILSFAIVAILPAILEETLFRGVILDGLMKRIKPVNAILLSSFLFGFIHLNPMQFVGAMMAGLFLGWVYWRTKSLVACMVIHGVNNALSFFLTLKYGVDATGETLVGKSNYTMLVIGSGVLFIAGVWWLSQRWKKSV